MSFYKPQKVKYTQFRKSKLDSALHPVQFIIRSLMLASPSDTQNLSLTAFEKMTPEGVKMACVIVGMVPILCVYPFLQKYFIFGMYTGSVKG